MRRRELALLPSAQQDLLEIWTLVEGHDGAARADGLLARIEAFVRSLVDFAEIGRPHDDRRRGLRSCGVPGLKRVTIIFLLDAERVTIIRIGYLGRNVLPADLDAG